MQNKFQTGLSQSAKTHHDMLVRPLVTHELAALIKKECTL
jgi:hypothetical protein